MILLTKKTDDIPFDLKQYSHIVYEGKISRLKDELTLRVRYFIDHPEKKHLEVPDALEYYVNHNNISSFTHIDLAMSDHNLNTGWSISFDIHNPGERTLDTAGMRFGFVFPGSLGEPSHQHDSVVALPNNTYMLVSEGPRSSRLLPKDWFHIDVAIFSKEVASIKQILGGSAAKLRQSYANCAIRAFTELGVREFPFVVWIK